MQPTPPLSPTWFTWDQHSLPPNLPLTLHLVLLCIRPSVPFQSVPHLDFTAKWNIPDDHLREQQQEQQASSTAGRDMQEDSADKAQITLKPWDSGRYVSEHQDPPRERDRSQRPAPGLAVCLVGYP